MIRFIVDVGPRTRIAKYKRTHFLDDEDELWIHPVLIGMSEMEAYLCCGFDGTKIIADKNHLYIPASWAIMEKPEAADDIMRMRRMAVEAAKEC